MTRRRHEARLDALAEERRDSGADRRDDNKRRRLEMVLDRVFRPSRWAARAAYAMHLQAARPVAVTRHVIAAARPASAPPLRIAFASDFHAGATTDERVIRAACDALSELHPDVLLLGGDLVSVRGSDIHALAPLLARVPAPLGKFGVYGNHDLRANRPEITTAMAAAGVRMLVNERVRLASPHEDVSIVGFDDPIRGTPDSSLLDEPHGACVLLMHAPDGLLAADDRSFDVALCGHTHGGQIVLPGGAMPYLPHGALSRTYPSGEYELPGPGDRRLVVSRGVGCSTVPVRVLCDAEVHLITVSTVAI